MAYLSRIQSTIAIDISDLEQLLEVCLKLLPSVLLLLQLCVLLGFNDAHHQWHELLVVDHTIVIHLVTRNTSAPGIMIVIIGVCSMLHLLHP